MGTRNEYIPNSYWDEMETQGLSLDAATLYLWSFMNPRCGMAGLYVVAERQILNGRMPPKRLRQALADVQAAEKLFYDPPLMWVRKRVARLAASPNVATAIARDVRAVPADHWLRVAFLDMYGQHEWLRDALAEVASESQNVKPLRRVPEDPSKALRRVVTADAVVGGES